LTNVIDVERQPERAPDITAADEAPVIKELRSCLSSDEVDRHSWRTVSERYHDAVHGLAQARELFTQGQLTLEQRGLAEQIYFAVCHQLRPLLQTSSRAHHDMLDSINDQLADKVFCNFSLFQSLPDVWAIDQVFPIMPLHRLDSRPERRAIITDITCDSDGRIDHYVDNEGVEASLPLHEWQPGQPYLLGIFMVGAYQEILGDCHNLFGDTHSANVELMADGSHRLYAQRLGDTVDSVLRAVDFNAADLADVYRQQVADSDLSSKLKAAYLEELEAGLTGYTYLED
jgi:arginine decarboxylase